MRICPACSTWRGAVSELHVDFSVSATILYCPSCGFNEKQAADSAKTTDLQEFRQSKRKRMASQLSSAARKRLRGSAA